MILVAINIVFLFCYAVLMIYYRWLWKRIPMFSVKDQFEPSTKVSVIIAARNEETHIGKCLGLLLAQDYPQRLLEIIVVDDDSTDHTAAVVEEMSNTQIRLVRSGRSTGNHDLSKTGKKQAISNGILEATGKLILTTDADCLPPIHWVKTMVAFYEEKKPVFIAAPVVFTGNNSPLGIFQSLDFISLQGITAAAVHHQFHNMSNGANLAYEKEIFLECGGFKGIDQIASGDDLLLIHKVAQRFPDKIKYCLSTQIIMPTIPPDTLKSFLHQRIRWASKARFYGERNITSVLILVYGLNLSLLLLFFLGFGSLQLFLWWVGFLVVKTVSELIFLIPVANFFRQSSLLLYFFPAQIFHIIYTVTAGFFGQFTRYEWKGRKLK